MATLDYDITHYQPVLFGAESMGHLEYVARWILRGFDDDTPDRLRVKSLKADLTS